MQSDVHEKNSTTSEGSHLLRHYLNMCRQVSIVAKNAWGMGTLPTITDFTSVWWRMQFGYCYTAAES